MGAPMMVRVWSSSAASAWSRSAWLAPCWWICSRIRSMPSRATSQARAAWLVAAVCAAADPVLDLWHGPQSHIAACHMRDPASGHSRAANA